MTEPPVRADKITTRKVRSTFPIRRRLRLRLWWMRRREPAEIRELRERLDRKLHDEIINGRRPLL